jgi:hypothetical protein
MVQARMAVMPPVKCAGTTRKGNPCSQWASPGGTTCRYHGAFAPQVKRKADLRLTLAHFLSSDPRDPRDVLLDAVHSFDAVMQHAKLKVAEGETLTVDELDRFIQSVQRAGALSKVAIDAGLVDVLTQQARIDLQTNAKIIAEAVVAAVDAIFEALPELDPARALKAREFALQTAYDYLSNVDKESSPAIKGELAS